jgi:hypothetical protein
MIRFHETEEEGRGGPGSRPGGGGRALISIIYLAGEDKSTKKMFPPIQNQPFN